MLIFLLSKQQIFNYLQHIKEKMHKLIDEIKSVEEIAKFKKERQSQYYKEFKKKNPNYYKEKNEKLRTENFEKSLFNQTKSYAKKRGIVFKIKLTDIVIPIRCPIINEPITKHIGGGKSMSNPCIYRINENEGYIKSNVMITCILANHMRSCASIEQLRVFAKNIIQMYG